MQPNPPAAGGCLRARKENRQQVNEQLRERIIEATGAEPGLVDDWVREGEITPENVLDCASRLVSSMSQVYAAEGRRFPVTVDQVAEYLRETIAEVLEGGRR
jgi:hypothetical protein